MPKRAHSLCSVSRQCLSTAWGILRKLSHGEPVALNVSYAHINLCIELLYFQINTITVVSSHNIVSNVHETAMVLGAHLFPLGALWFYLLLANHIKDDDDDYAVIFCCLLMICQFMYLIESDHSRWLLSVYLALSIRCVHAETRG